MAQHSAVCSPGGEQRHLINSCELNGTEYGIASGVIAA